MAREVWIDGVKYVREDIIRHTPTYLVKSGISPAWAPFSSLADATWHIRCLVERGHHHIELEVR